MPAASPRRRETVKEYEPILELVALLSGLLAFRKTGGRMNAWYCVLLISLAGAVGGVINAMLSGHRLTLPSYQEGVWCPGFIGNVLIGAVAALTSWALYGSGAGVELGSNPTLRAEISLKLPALAGALMVGMAGAKWLTSESDKGLYKESIKEAGKKPLTDQQREKVVQGSALNVLQSVKAA